MRSIIVRCWAEYDGSPCFCWESRSSRCGFEKAGSRSAAAELVLAAAVAFAVVVAKFRTRLRMSILSRARCPHSVIHVMLLVVARFFRGTENIHTHVTRKNVNETKTLLCTITNQKSRCTLDLSLGQYLTDLTLTFCNFVVNGE
jgi:hypothetical protein